MADLLSEGKCLVKRTRIHCEEEMSRNVLPLLERMTNIKVKTISQTVPPFLQNSELFQTLTSTSSDDDDDEKEESNTVSIPGDCFKCDDIIATESDLISLLKSLQFWISKEVPISLYEFAFAVPFCHLFVKNVTDSDFARDMPFVHDLLMVVKESSVSAKFVCAMNRRVSDDLLSFMMHFYDSPDTFLESSVAEKACSMGNLSIIQFAHEHGCPLHCSNCLFAAKKWTLKLSAIPSRTIVSMGQ